LRYKIDVPKPSAKRLEKDRCVVINESGAFHSYNREFPIPEGVEEFEFEFEFEENDPFINRELLDADIYYSWHIRYRNSTGSREETISFELKEAE